MSTGVLPACMGKFGDALSGYRHSGARSLQSLREEEEDVEQHIRLQVMGCAKPSIPELAVAEGKTRLKLWLQTPELSWLPEPRRKGMCYNCFITKKNYYLMPPALLLMPPLPA